MDGEGHEADRVEHTGTAAFAVQRLMTVAIVSITASFVLTMLFFVVVRLTNSISLLSSAIQVMVVLSGAFIVVGALFGVYLLVKQTREEQRAIVKTGQKTEEQVRKQSESAEWRPRGFAFASPVKSPHPHERQGTEEQLRDIWAAIDELRIKVEALSTQKDQETERSE